MARVSTFAEDTPNVLWRPAVLDCIRRPALSSATTRATSKRLWLGGAEGSAGGRRAAGLSELQQHIGGAHVAGRESRLQRCLHRLRIPDRTGFGSSARGSTFQGGRDIPASVRRIQRHKIQVAGSFVVGLDVDRAGIGRRVAETAGRYGVDMLNVLFLTPLPGTRLWDQMNAERRVRPQRLPAGLGALHAGIPRGSLQASLGGPQHRRSGHLRSGVLLHGPLIAGRVARDLRGRRQPLSSLVSSLAARRNARLSRVAHADFKRDRTSVESGYASGVAPQPDESPIVRIAVQ